MYGRQLKIALTWVLGRGENLLVILLRCPKLVEESVGGRASLIASLRGYLGSQRNMKIKHEYIVVERMKIGEIAEIFLQKSG